MLKTTITAILAYISTGSDYLMVLLALFAIYKDYKSRFLIWLGDYVGTTILISISLFTTFILHFVPDPGILGLLGLIPIMIGIRLWIKGDDDSSATDKIKGRKIFTSVTFITVATCGADNIGIYVPLFSTMEINQIIYTLVIFAIMVSVFFLIGVYTVKIPIISSLLEKYSSKITSTVYILLGLYILLDNGTITEGLSLILRR